MYSAGHADIMKHKKDVGGESMLTLDMVREAQEALRGIARRTPLDRAPKFGENVYIKAENLQLTGAFKLRGAYNKIRSLTPEEAEEKILEAREILAGKGIYCEHTTAANYAAYLEFCRQNGETRDCLITMCGAGLKSDH